MGALGNESDGGPMKVFHLELEHDVRVAIMKGSAYWDRTNEELRWVDRLSPMCQSSTSQDEHSDAFFENAVVLDDREAERWVGEVAVDADEENDDGLCTKENARSMREAVMLLNDAGTRPGGGGCFRFARALEGVPCTYTVGVGCICVDGSVVGWSMQNVVWT